MRTAINCIIVRYVAIAVLSEAWETILNWDMKINDALILTNADYCGLHYQS